ncbi:MAG TPA: protein kinase [Dictyobacter sp.]|jgi:serine/threonine protein kinase|nr:protein kinase [Dictyobacter sp.]
MAIPHKEQVSLQQDLLLGQTLHNGEYLIQQVLGQGGMGKVYLAIHTTLAISFALKQVPADLPLPESASAELDYILQGGDLTHRTYPTMNKAEEFLLPSSGGPYTDRFLREALFLARLQHAAIPTLYAYFQEDDYWYLVMYAIPGLSLSTYLAQEAPLAPLDALHYAIQLCDILDYLHRQEPPIVFRDLKPVNILLTPDRGLVLVDFGIAQYLLPPAVRKTVPTEIGSPGYASPEQIQKNSQLDVRTDLYSLGIILREMISGERPLNSHEEYDLSLTKTGYASTYLAATITLATQADPQQRFQSANAFYLALERAYRIEEHHSYQQAFLADFVDAEQLPITGEHPVILSDEEAQLDIIETQHEGNYIFDLQRRRLIRETLQRTHQEVFEQEQLELQFASVDESLRRRSSMSLSQLSLHSYTVASPPVQEPPKASIYRIIQASFVLALILCLVLTSLLVYARVIPHTTSTQNMSIKQPLSPLSTIAASNRNISNTAPAEAEAESHWQAIPSLPASEADNTAAYVSLQGKAYIYMSGGYRGNQHPAYDHNLYRYDIAAAQWQALTIEQLPGMVNNTSTVGEQGHLFLTAGYSSTTYEVTSLLYDYEPQTGTVETIHPPTAMPLGFANAMIADQHGHLYISQGFMQAGNIHARATTGWYRFDIATRTWHALRPLPEGLGYETLALGHNNDILLFGGAYDAEQRYQSNRVYRYDIETNTWSQSPDSAPEAFSATASCQVWPDQLIFVGGFDIAHQSGSTDVWLFNSRTFQWKQLSAFPAGKSVLGTASCDGHGHAYLTRGASDPHNPTTDFWRATIAPHVNYNQDQ